MKNTRAVVNEPYRILYDSDCEFCRRSMSLIKQLDKENLTQGVPLCEQALTDLNVPASIDECTKQMHVVSGSGKIYVGFFAIIKLASLFPQTKALAWLAWYLLPAGFGCLFYRLIANNRYRLSRCSGGHCKLR